MTIYCCAVDPLSINRLILRKAELSMGCKDSDEGAAESLSRRVQEARIA
jgi:hypothetical protein